jgi:hypothetical protein
MGGSSAVQAPAHQVAVALDRLVPKDDSLARTPPHREKNPVLLHLRQLALESQNFLVTGSAGAGERLAAVLVLLAAPAPQLVVIDADIPGYLADAGSGLSGQANCLTLELVGVSLSFGHDTPPAP